MNFSLTEFCIYLHIEHKVLSSSQSEGMNAIHLAFDMTFIAAEHGQISRKPLFFLR